MKSILFLLLITPMVLCDERQPASIPPIAQTKDFFTAQMEYTPALKNRYDFARKFVQKEEEKEKERWARNPQCISCHRGGFEAKKEPEDFEKAAHEFVSNMQNEHHSFLLRSMNMDLAKVSMLEVETDAVNIKFVDALKGVQNLITNDRCTTCHNKGAFFTEPVPKTVENLKAAGKKFVNRMHDKDHVAFRESMEEIDTAIEKMQKLGK